MVEEAGGITSSPEGPHTHNNGKVRVQFSLLPVHLGPIGSVWDLEG